MQRMLIGSNPLKEKFLTCLAVRFNFYPDGLRNEMYDCSPATLQGCQHDRRHL